MSDKRHQFLSLPLKICTLSANPVITHGQGDQIGRIFAYWAIVWAGFFKNDLCSANFCATFPYYLSRVLLLTNNGLGLHLWRFFSKTHPVTLPTAIT
jgi:hypothetical protein